MTSDWLYRRLCIEIAKYGRNKEPNEIQRETSQILPKVFAALHEEKISRSDVADTLTIPRSELEQLKGRYYWNQRTPQGIRKSIELYQQAVEQDPNFALGYAGLADAHNFTNILGVVAPKDSFPEAKAAATRALLLDPDLSEAHAALGLVKSHYDFDFTGAQREFLKAIELNPNSANAHLFYSGGYFTPMGRHEEAIAEMKKALKLDPLSPSLNNYMALTYMFAGEYEKSFQQFERTIELDPTFAETHFFFARLLEETGQFEMAIAEDQKGESLLGEILDQALVAEFLKALRTLGPLTLKSYKQAGTGYFAAIRVAEAYARVGDKETALKWLEKSYENREGQSITLVRWKPCFQNLRGDPRFGDLLKRMGLPN